MTRRWPLVTGGGSGSGSGGGYERLYEVDFGAIATSVDLTASGDTAYDVDGISWDVLGTANVDAADVDAADGAGEGIVVSFNSNNPAGYAFHMSTLLSNLSGELDANSDLRAFLQYESNADATFESVGVRFVTSNNAQGAATNFWTAGMSVGSSPDRGYLEGGFQTPSAAGYRTPLNFDSTATDCMCVQIINGVVGFYLFNTSGGDLPTSLEGAAHMGSFVMPPTSASAHNSPADDRMRVALVSYPGNTGANFDPKFKKLAVDQRS